MFRNFFNFKGTRKPDFSKIQKIDYNEYWKNRGFQLRGKLMERELIFFNWIPDNVTVLNAGCGNSRLLLELKTKKNCICTAIDSSPLVAAGQHAAGIETRVANLEDDNFTLKEKYDFVILSEVLEHLRQPENLIAKIIPNAKYLILSIPNSAFYRYRLGLIFNGRFMTQWAQHPSEHLRYWSHIDFLDWLAAVGLEVAAFQSSNGFQLKNIWPNMFGHQICYLAKTKNK